MFQPCSGCWQVVFRKASLTSPQAGVTSKGICPRDLLLAVDQGRELCLLMYVLPEAASAPGPQGVGILNADIRSPVGPASVSPDWCLWALGDAVAQSRAGK